MLGHATREELRAAALSMGLQALLDEVRAVVEAPAAPQRRRIRFVGDDDERQPSPYSEASPFCGRARPGIVCSRPAGHEGHHMSALGEVWR